MKHYSVIGATVICLIAFMMLAGCDSDSNPIDTIKDTVSTGARASVEDDDSLQDRDNTPKVLVPEASGANTAEGGGAIVDYSNADSGYLMVKYTGDNQKVKVLITYQANEPYTYDLQLNGDYNTFPLSQGSGDYTVGVYENIEGEKYVPAVEQAVNADIGNQLTPFLYPNQFTNFNENSACVAKAQEVCDGAKSDIGATEKIFLFVVDTVTYDFDKAENVQSGYVPDPDETLQTETGICFDYASLTASMMRSQNIPCQLIVGYAGSAYHAWIAAYSTETGKVASIIQFQADQFNKMDPTFVAGGNNADPNLIGDGSTYNPLFFY